MQYAAIISNTAIPKRTIICKKICKFLKTVNYYSQKTWPYYITHKTK